MPNSSRPSAGATYLNKQERLEELRQAAGRARSRLPSVSRIVLFGSLVQGIPTPRSDADLLVQLEASEHENPRDRIPGMLRALAPLPCPVDLFIFTSQEIEHLRREGSPLLRAALENGLDLLPPPGA